MRFTVNMTCDNAAFEEDPAAETARILRDMAQKLEMGQGDNRWHTILDVNGNDVGRWKLDHLS
jgi:hypothetical protein